MRKQIDSLFQLNKYHEIDELLSKYENQPGLEIYRIRLKRATASYDIALEMIEKYLDNQKISFEDKAETLIEKAHCYWYRDQRDELQKILDEVEKLLEGIDAKSERNKHIKANYLHLRAIGAKNFATTDKTIKLLRESIKIKEEINEKNDLALSYNNLGYYYWVNNKFDEAIKNLDLSLKINTSILNEEQIALNLINLIQISVATEDLKNATNFLIQLEDLYNRNRDNKLINRYYSYCNGLLRTHSTNLRKKLEAEDIFEDIINSEFVISSLYIKSIFNLCNLYIFQLKISYDPILFDKLVDRITLLYDFGMKTKMGTTILKAEFLQCKILAFKGNLKPAKKLLIKLSDDAIHLGDVQMSNLVAIELAAILEKEKISDTAKSMKYNFNNSDLDELLTHFITNRSPELPISNEVPISFLILKNDGNQIFSAHFDDDVQFNSYLVSSFISAINSFGNQIFGIETGGLDKIKHQDYNILIRKKNNVMYCYIHKGDSHMSVIRLTSTIDEISHIVEGIGDIVIVDHYTKELLDKKVYPIFEFNSRRIT